MSHFDSHQGGDESAQGFAGARKGDGTFRQQGSGQYLGGKGSHHAGGSGGDNDQRTFTEFDGYADTDAGAGHSGSHFSHDKQVVSDSSAHQRTDLLDNRTDDQRCEKPQGHAA